MKFDCVYYEPDSLEYPLGQLLRKTFGGLPWFPVESHNRIPDLIARPNADFALLKRVLVVGTRKTHRYAENAKVSDYLVPYTSSGCTAMCLYCYLVCNYNKCSYLRLFVNREEMLDRLLAFSQAHPGKVFEIGSNSDLVLENKITGNLVWTIPQFANSPGRITFPTKFDMVEPLLDLNHGGNCIFRMSVNPPEIIRRVELGTSSLAKRLAAVERMCEAGYPTGILIAPVIFTRDWKRQYADLVAEMAQTLSPRVKRQLFFEVIFMTYSYVQREINAAAFPNAPPLHDPANMVSGGRKYYYRMSLRAEGEAYLRELLEQHFPKNPIVYFC